MKKVLIVLVLLIGGFAGYVASRPSQFHIERSATMSGRPEDAFEVLSDFHNWGDWSPWEKLDPTMKKTHSGPPSGTGAHYEWVGNDKVGEGAMTITSAQPPEKIVIKLEFKKPFEQTNTTTFGIKAQPDDKVTVSWAMDGENNFMGKAFGVFMDMDKMVGGDFDKGLASLKTIVEAKAQKRKADAEAAKKAEEAAKPGAPAEAAPAAPAAPAKK